MFPDTSELPKEVLDAMIPMHAAVKRVRKAETQYDSWGKELIAARENLRAAEKTYGEVSLRWDTAANVVKPREELN
jgi:hypothetical protein